VNEGPGSPVIELSEVSKLYRNGDLAVEALRGLSFVVRSGELVAVMGPSGSGKTTLLGILGCLDRPTTGSYRLVGQETADLDETRRARIRAERIGFVFQAYNLIPRSTAYKNVELPLVYAGVPGRERRRRVLEALDEVGLAERSRHVPSQLSGGEQQRVAIARALVGRPSVLLADEPTGNLDPDLAVEIMRLFREVNARGTTVVVATHDLDLIARMQRRTIVLEHGRLSPEGVPA
jgi:putative ABC transport system ATP-binding protein